MKRQVRICLIVLVCLLIGLTGSVLHAEDEDMNLVDTWVQSESNGGGKFNYPIGIATDSEGNFYISDAVNSRVQKLNSEGKFIQFIGAPVWGESGILESEVHYPIGLDIDERDNLYVADTDVAEIKVFDKNGTFLRRWGVVQGDESPQLVGIACGNGCVYVTDMANNRVLKYTLEGEFQSQWGHKGSENGQFNYPSGIDLDESGQVYVSEIMNRRIQVFASNDEFITSFSSGIENYDSWFAGSALRRQEELKPSDVTGSWPIICDVCVASEDIYVSDPMAAMIRIISREDTSSCQGVYINPDYMGDHIDNGDRARPGGLTLLSGDLFNSVTTNYSDDGIIKMDLQNGNDLEWFTGTYGVCDEDTVNKPVGMVIDKERDKIFVVNFWECRIQRFDLDGNFELAWGKRGSGEGELHLPEGLAIDASGDIYVNDAYNGRIQKFDADGNHLLTIGEYGMGEGQFSRNVGIAVGPEGKIYVTDMDKGDVQIFNTEGNLLDRWTSFDSGTYEFVSPRGVGVDNGFVYVVDELNYLYGGTCPNKPAKVFKFTLDGNAVTTWDLTPSNSGGCPRLYDITFDEEGDLYIADTANGQILKFEPDGTRLDQWEISGPFAKFNSSPQGIALDDEGYLFVADFMNSSISGESKELQSNSLSASDVDQNTTSDTTTGGMIAKYSLRTSVSTPTTTSGGGGGGCNISYLMPALGALVLPLLFLIRK